MTAISPPPPPLLSLVERLIDSYSPPASRQDVTLCVAAAWEAVRFMSATEDDDIAQLAGRIAERDLRLRLGLEREGARLDPERHGPR